MSSETRRILLEAAIILLLGVVLGLSVNYRLVLRTFQDATIPPVGSLTSSTVTARWPAPVDLPALRLLLEKGAVPIDARSRDLFRRGHLPGARSFPLGKADRWMAAFHREFPPATPLVVYCSGGGCPDAFDLAARLLKEGYRDVRVFEGGFPAWRDAGLPVAGRAP